MISKTNLGEFDNISIFNEEYILVERKGLFNLIDKDGNYVSKIWYKGIRKDSGCGADFIEPRTQHNTK